MTEKPASFSTDHPFLEQLRRIARDRRTAIVAGFPESNGDAPGRPYNTLLLIDPDGSI